MLGKMMKYDLMFGAGKYAFMAALTAALLIAAVAASTLDNMLIMGLSIFFGIVATVVYAVMYLVISIRHLATQLCSNESYLGYSLPSSSHTLVLSKLLCIFIWGVVTLLLVVFFWAVGIGGIALSQSEISLGELWGEIGNAMRMAGVNFGAIISFISWTGLTSSLMSLALLGFCVVLCNVPFLKERGIGIVTGVVGYFVLQTALNYVIARGVALFFNPNNFVYNNTDIITDIGAMTAYFSIAYTAAAVGLYFLTVYMVDKHKFIG
jgi:hypothetical protein